MKAMKSVWAGATLLFGFIMCTSAQAITVEVVDQAGDPVSGFKWLLEEDTTHTPEPGVHKPVAADVRDNTLSISIHRSYNPVVASGESAGDSAEITTTASGAALPAGRYFVSVLPFGDRSTCDGTFDIGGSPVTVDTGTETVTVYVRRNPLETAQIALKIFHDILPLNNAPDVAEVDPESSTNPLLETMEGFTVSLTEQGGEIVGDGYGNPLGTTYVPDSLDPSTCEPIIDVLGTGDLVTPPSGELLIKNMLPGKYGVEVVPPAGEGWYQTTTIEGGQAIDAWIRPDEPPFLVEFGPPLFHVAMGFAKELNILPAALVTGTITGTVAKSHPTRPPREIFHPGPVPEGEAVGERCMVALNSSGVGFAETLFVGLCEDETGEFEIPGVPPGLYQIVVWDIQMLKIITFGTVVVPATGGVVNAGDADGILVTPEWFAVQEHNVYFDDNRDGRRQDTEVGIPEQNVNLRFRDGTIYSAFPTDTSGFVPFQKVFPFFRFLVPEVDFARFQATGLEVVVDDGGAVTHNKWGEGKRNPQDQTGLPGGNALRRVETGAVLTQASQDFQGQNNRFNWGKSGYDDDVNAVVRTSEADYFASTLGWPSGPGDVDTCLPGAFSPVNCDAGVPGKDGIYNANGGISGILFYATTRAEDDPRFAAGEEWEPGIPNAQINLYRDEWCYSNGGPAVYPDCPESIPGEIGDGIPDNRNGNATINYADVDNYPLNWAPEHCSTGGQTCSPGPEDIDHNGNDIFNLGDAIRVAWTDSWDDSLPEDCVGDVDPLTIHADPVPISQCAEGLRTWNQVRPAVFDGGFAFGPGDELLIPGTYLVQAIAPPGYKDLKEEDRNVDFGNTPIPALLPPKCFGLNPDGSKHTVPPLFSFLTDAAGDPLPGVDPGDPDNAAPFAGEERYLCNMKRVDLGAGQNAASDFFVFTDVPKAARAVGLITDDFANELAPGKPQFTEKFSPPWISYALFDYSGREIARSSGDEYGSYNFLAPSTYGINPPTPSGITPKVMQSCLNHPGPIEDPDNPGEFITDPLFKPQYSTTCYQFQFEAGRTSYLDTPVIRQAAFVGALQQTLDCEAPTGMPAIKSVMNLDSGEPAIMRDGSARLEIRSMGTTEVPNPDYPGDSIINATGAAGSDGFPDDPPSEPEFVTRKYGFGSAANAGDVCIGDYCFSGAEVDIWADHKIVLDLNGAGEFATALGAGLETGQLTITRSNGKKTKVGLTVTIDDGAGSVGGSVHHVGCAPDGNFCTGSIQAAIDAASDGDLILVDPGVYPELLFLYKRVKLQGAGAGSTTLWASHHSIGGDPFENPVDLWRDKLAELTDGSAANGEIGLLPEQQDVEQAFKLKDGEAAGITVAPPPGVFNFAGPRENYTERARIDGFKIELADLGGAIYVNAYAKALLIANNELTSNGSNLGGGIRVGNPTVVQNAGVSSTGGIIFPTLAVETSPNTLLDIRHNDINQNGSFKTGGGIGIFKGATNYNVNDNLLCGNFARSGGGGIAHRGLSDKGDIYRNEIIFNEVFQGDQPAVGLGVGGGGGGIEIAGDRDPTGETLTEGTGSVRVFRNLLQGNLAGASDGGGIALRNTNGEDVEASPGDSTAWWKISLLNNMIVNNVAGLGGAGVSLENTMRAVIVHNTIANNDATATSSEAFRGGLTTETTPQPAGIVSRPLSGLLKDAVGPGTPDFAVPAQLRRNIVVGNRTFFYDVNAPAPKLTLNPAGDYWDLGVVGAPGQDDTDDPECLAPTQSVLSDLTPTADPVGCDYTGDFNLAADPDTDAVKFKAPYVNTIVTAAAADEGGNFVQVYFTPLGKTGNYHIKGTSPAKNAPPASSPVSGLLSEDFDGETRPRGTSAPDTGADEQYP